MFSFNKTISAKELHMLCIRGQSRIDLCNQKKNSEISALSSDIVSKYQKGEIEFAKIRVENVIYLKREVFAYQLLHQYLVTIDSRVEMLLLDKEVPQDMQMCIGTILYSKNIVDCDELKQVCGFLEKKYKKVVQLLINGCDPRFLTRMTPVTPLEHEIETALADVLNRRGISYTPICVMPSIGGIDHRRVIPTVAQTPMRLPSLINTVPDAYQGEISVFPTL